jgi:hypothetical protein
MGKRMDQQIQRAPTIITLSDAHTEPTRRSPAGAVLHPHGEPATRAALHREPVTVPDLQDHLTHHTVLAPLATSSTPPR